MIKGLAITPPIIGRISIGSIVETRGKRLPVKLDYFSVTSQVQGKDGWINHPIFDELLKTSESEKLRSIPVRLLFSEPDLNLRTEYSLFDRQSGRPLCVGNGETCRRYTASGMQNLPCPSPDFCELAKSNACKPFGRLNVLIGDSDELGTFIFRTTGFNSIRSLIARLSYYRALSNNLLPCLPLELRLRSKSTTMSHRSAIYYVDLTIREGLSLEAAITQATTIHEKRLCAGFNQDALDQAARAGLKNGAFEECDEERVDIIEEFFPSETNETCNNKNRQCMDIDNSSIVCADDKNKLLNKLNAKIRR